VRGQPRHGSPGGDVETARIIDGHLTAAVRSPRRTKPPRRVACTR
jgi:hypothetical protein